MATTQLTRTVEKPQIGAWSAIFPNEQVTEEKSMLFVKKLLAVAVSNVTYLRAIFPEHAFGDRCLEDLNLKILRDDSACPGACQVIQWVKGCFDALDKKYLRTIIMAIYKDKEDPQTIVESYTFKFSYSAHEGVSIYHNGSMIAGAYGASETRKATIKLLRTIIVLTQTLRPLPDNLVMTMKLLYYDDVTPSDYEPPGFKATEDYDQFHFKEEPMNIRVGDVSTPFHTVKFRIKTDCEQFSLCDTQDDHMISKESHTTSKDNHMTSEMISKESHMTSKDDHMTSKDNNKMEVDPPTLTITEAKGEANEPTEKAAYEDSSSRDDDDVCVKCSCGYNTDEGLMILCGICDCWQHASCYGLLDEEDVPELHVCVKCARESKGAHQCSDPTLAELDDVSLEQHCLWRRSLVLCMDMNKLQPHKLAKELGVEILIVNDIVSRMEREGFVRKGKSTRGGRAIAKNAIKTMGFKNYFRNMAISHVDNSTEDKMESLTQQTSTLNLSTSMLKPIAKEDVMQKDQEVRRSPRLAKRVRPVNGDSSLEFELSESQDPGIESESKPRKKRRKASIASRAIVV